MQPDMPAGAQDRRLALHGTTVHREPRHPPSDLVATREQAMQQRRQDQQDHRHDQIWIKDPHGGPYRKASAAGKLRFSEVTAE